MHIKQISIKNLRNFSVFKINFNDGFQTIIGENNIGKSNLYWATRLVLDTNLSYNNRKLEEKDFHGFPELALDSFVLISIDFYGENIANFPNLHVLKKSDHEFRVTYLYAHKSKLSDIDEAFDHIKIQDFQWRLYGGGDSLEFDDVTQLSQISHKDLEGINLYYITGFRNINSDLFGSAKSLLTEYCKSRENAETELEDVKGILSNSTTELNDLGFIPQISDAISNKNTEIAGNHFTFPVSLGFVTESENDIWSQLKIFYNPGGGQNVPLHILGLGQKNLLYLTLFLSKLINEQDSNEINLLLIEEPEAHLHPQLQKILFSKLSGIQNTQVFMTSHSTHIASDCDFKNLNVLYKSAASDVKSYSPFISTPADAGEQRDQLLLKRYLDATRSELFFASCVIFVEGVAEQFVIPSIAKNRYGVDLNEYNISVIPIHSRYFDPFLKLFQNNNLEINVCAIIDGDESEHEDGSVTTAVANAKACEVADRVLVFDGTKTLETDVFPDKDTNIKYLELSFINLGHQLSYNNLIASDGDWSEELIKRVDGTIKKGRFAQELALNIDEDFEVPQYIKEALNFVFQKNNIAVVC